MFRLFRCRPPETVSQQAAQSSRTRFNPFERNEYVFKEQPRSRAALNYAYENLGLTEFSPIGPAVANRGRLDVFGPPPLIAMQGLWQQGVGGLVQGTVWGQPLVNTAEIQAYAQTNPAQGTWA